jgi:putative ABC transport system permease protein
MDTFFKDVKHSIRMFVNSPGFAVTAIAALALGIGAPTAIFSVVNAVLLKPLPIPDPDRFVMLMNTFVSPKGEKFSGPGASPVKFAHWRAQSSVTEDVSAFRNGVMNYTGGEGGGTVALHAGVSGHLPLLGNAHPARARLYHRRGSSEGTQGRLDQRWPVESAFRA